MLRYSQHATERMDQREIDQSVVETVLRDPQATWPDRTRPADSTVSMRTVDGRRIKVVTRRTDNGGQLVVTVVILSGNDE